jgi:D-3-phosphoglycerate dehydrogenase
MYKIHCLNKISKIGLSVLKNTYELTDQIDLADAVLVRSQVMHDITLKQSVLAVARAGAGVNNIPLDLYAKSGVVVFNTPGANANAVAELTLAGMLLASRDIYGGIKWIENNKHDPEIAKTVEKAKAQFGGTEIYQKSIGIVGLGAIGRLIANKSHALGLKVYAYEKFMDSINLSDLPSDIHIVSDLEALYPHVDFISLNVPLIPETKGMINKETIKLMKDGVVILNFARDALVNDNDIEVALKDKKVRKYVTDFPNERSANIEGVIAIPHLGASTEEAEDNCAMMASHQIMAYIEQGNIKNSVNYPDISLGNKQANHRILVLFDATSAFISQINVSNIINKTSKTKGNYGVWMADTNQLPDLNDIKSINGVIKVRII